MIMLSFFHLSVICVCAAAGYLLLTGKRRKRKQSAFGKIEVLVNGVADKTGSRWSKTQHEYHVEKFYETGLTGEHDFHGGYLNFGYWENNNNDYVTASEALLSLIADAVDLDTNSRLLDVANGSGAQDIFYYKKYKPKHIDMIDVTLSHHLICKSRISEHRLHDRLTAHYGSAVNLPFQDNSFTHVFSVEGGIHFPTRLDFLKEAYRVLESNGWISMVDFTIDAGKCKNYVERLIGHLCGWLWNVPRENHLPLDKLKKCVEDVGFTRVELVNISDSCIPGYYYESKKSEVLEELCKIRGWFATYIGSRIIDELLWYTYKREILAEVIVYARKQPR